MSLLLTATVGCDEQPLDGAKAAASSSANAGGLNPRDAAAVLARVGDRTITLGDFAAVLDNMDQFQRLKYQTTKGRQALLEEMIEA